MVMNDKKIYMGMYGRMGNNLFQAATAYAMSLEYNCDFYMTPDYSQYAPEPDCCGFKTYLEKYKNSIYRKLKYSDFIGKPITYQEPEFKYNKIPFINNMHINGYFQSDKYFNNYKNEVFDLFKIDENTDIEIKEKYSSILSNETVSINVRHGIDYRRLNNLFNVLPIEYYNKCIEYFGKNKVFIITSDDVEWCKENFKNDNCYIVDQDNPLVDLYIQTLCENNIISCSSFSWWGAWLNKNEDKKVIIPTPWFGSGFNHDTRDIYPENWLKQNI